MTNSNYGDYESNFPTSNIVSDNEMVSSARNVTGEKAERGHFKTGSIAISDDEANDNPNVVKRNGFRMATDGDYQPGDVVMYNGLELTVEQARQFGVMGFVPDQTHDHGTGEDISGETESGPETTLHPDAELLGDQVRLRFGDRAPQVMDVFVRDLTENGEMSEAGLAFAKNELGFPPEYVRDTVRRLEAVGTETLKGFLKAGDNLGEQRMQFLAGIATHGGISEKQAVRRLWTDAALGRINRKQAADAYAKLVNRYA
ncbi:hypothetical protein [Wenxinia marina]|uniref:Uncharacterized protein n=1 Tax=Wenxinia marina DSM 24838 TaxID=1123501 RepID=A0A0D0QF77_9RHOB|nr:hypothetical protein [Wenxinia marina]KIQ70982.1 hypothetical protein Wenmar_00359 [Wenxinia marina DSM 24838]GGL55769.1 hypothetical protein GCM10011392_07750 [Wenxinia marina]